MAIINGTSVGGMTLQADYSYAQNTSANTSTVTVTLKLVNHYALYASALSGSYLSVGGNRSDYSKSISYGGSSTTTTTLYGPKTVTVQHNSDGTGSCAISGTFVMNGTYRGSYVGTMSVSSTITLPKIARASGLTVPSSVNTGSAFSGTITPSSTAFNHKVQLKIGSTVKDTVTLAAGTNTFNYTIPHSWFPSSTSGTVTAVLETYNGSTFIASVSKNITANVPTSIVPSISAFTAAIAENGLSGLYVQGKTTAKLTATASAGSGSSISKYVYSGPDLSVSTTSNNTTTSAIKSSGTLTYYVQVTDGRGRTASNSVQIYVYPYSTPSIGSVSVQRCDSNGNLTESGTYAKYTVNTSFSSVNGKNTRTVTAAYSSNNGSTYSSATTIQATTDTASSKTGTYGDGAFALANSYIIKFTITDAYGATSFTTRPLLSAQRPINIRANGKGVAIGGMSTKEEFECSFNADFNKNVNVDGNITLGGSLRGQANAFLNAIELGSGAAPPNHGGYIDFHYNGSTSDYTSRIIESTQGVVEVTSSLKTPKLTLTSSTAPALITPSLQIGSNNVADFVIQQGASGSWTIRKWNSGIAECWRKITGTVTNSGTWNNFRIFSGGADFPSGFFIANPNVQYCCYIGTGYAINCRGALSTTTRFNWAALGTDSDSNVGYIVDCYAIGKWK
jgi:hypothetical protein